MNASTKITFEKEGESVTPIDRGLLASLWVKASLGSLMPLLTRNHNARFWSR